MTFSIDSELCKICPLFNDCEEKRMALCAVMDNGTNSAELQQATVLPSLETASVYEETREWISKEIFCAFGDKR